MSIFKKHFDPAASEFHLGNAYCLAEAASLSYSGYSTIKKKVLKEWGFDDCEFFDAKGTQAFLAADKDKIIVSFRGTEPVNLKDWMTDFELHLTPAYDGIKLHTGFSKALSHIWPEIHDKIVSLRRPNVIDLSLIRHGAKPGSGKVQSLWFTGHSLGGALATLAVSYMSIKMDEPFKGLYTFGQPRVGDQEFARIFNSYCQNRMFRFVNKNDIVSRVPPRSLGYSHVGTFRYLDVKGEVLNDIGYWDRFLDSVRGRLEDFVQVFKGSLIFDGIDDHSMLKGYLPSLKNSVVKNKKVKAKKKNRAS